MLILLLLCGCGAGEEENSQTRFLLDTVADITASCDDETLDGAFELCERLERVLSRTAEESDVYRLNSSDGFVSVSEDTVKVIERSVYYSELSNGSFDITVCPVSELWDFKNQVVPSRDEIAEALKSVDYHSIEIKENKISLNGKKIDLGGIAKGYITDCVREYFADRGVEKALINLGGNIGMIGRYTIGIKKPFGDGTVASVELDGRSISTSGIYERYIEKDDRLYHHVIDPKTGYGAENETASVTVIGEKSFDCDALSTVCLLLGTEKGLEIIEGTENTEAVFIGRDGKITLSTGLCRENDKIIYR